MRLKEYDYSQAGAYFVTLVTQGRLCLFGEIVGEEMLLNDLGRVADREMIRLEERFQYVSVPQHIVMPNHAHAIIWIRDDAVIGNPSVGAKQEEPCRTVESPLASPLRADRSSRPWASNPAGLLGRIVATYKAFTARLINGLRHTPGHAV